jgi:F0F1-type ATP synthase assembly protein I
VPITVSLVLLLGLSVWILHRYAGLKFWHAITCLLFGFFLATTSVAPMIRSAVSNVIAFLTGQH